MDILNLMH